MKFAMLRFSLEKRDRNSLKISDYKEIELSVLKAHRAGYTVRFTKAWDIAAVSVVEGDKTILVCTGRLAKEIIELTEEELDDDEINSPEYEKEKKLISAMAEEGILYLLVGPVTISF